VKPHQHFGEGQALARCGEVGGVYCAWVKEQRKGKKELHYHSSSFKLYDDAKKQTGNRKYVNIFYIIGLQ